MLATCFQHWRAALQRRRRVRTVVLSWLSRAHGQAMLYGFQMWKVHAALSSAHARQTVSCLRRAWVMCWDDGISLVSVVSCWLDPAA